MHAELDDNSIVWNALRLNIQWMMIIYFQLFLFEQGPVLRGWFLTLDKGFGPTHTVRDAMKKVFFDQFVFAPILTAILLSVFGFSQGMDRLQTREKLKAVRKGCIIIPIA